MLTLEDVRVDVGGVPEVEGLSLRVDAKHVAIVGGGLGLFDVIAGIAAPRRGRVLIDDEGPRALVAEGALAALVIDAPMPARWTALEHATWSARLAGAEDRARALASEIFAELTIDPRAKLGGAPLSTLRATLIAGALATDARVFVMQDFTVGLEATTARHFARAVAKRLEERAWVWFCATLPLASPMALAADEALVVRGSEVALRGAPAELAARDRAYVVRATGDLARFALLVNQAGGRVSAGEKTMAIELGALEVKDLFALAEEANATVVEVVPQDRAFT